MPQPIRTLVLPDFARHFFVLIVVVILGLFAWIISPFFTLLVYAALITVIFSPLHRALKQRFLMRWPSLAALLSTLLVVVLFLVPMTLFFILLTEEAASAYGSLTSRWSLIHLSELRWSSLDQLPWFGPWLERAGQRLGFEDFVHGTSLDLLGYISTWGQQISAFVVSQSAALVGAVGTVVLQAFLLLMAIFFFFRDGERFIVELKLLSPLPSRYEVEIENKLRDTTRAIVMGGFVASLLQGLIGALGFAIAGVANIIFLGTLMAFASLVPYVGAALVWVPVGLALLIQGHSSLAIFIFLWGFCVVSLVDNLARPFLIGSQTKMNPLLTFLTVLGGLYLFGLKGVVFGPLVLTLTLAILHIYRMEYGKVLEE